MLSSSKNVVLGNALESDHRTAKLGIDLADIGLRKGQDQTAEGGLPRSLGAEARPRRQKGPRSPPKFHTASDLGGGEVRTVVAVCICRFVKKTEQAR